MKRFHKLLSLVLCIAMVVSVMAVAFTAQATAAETQTAQTGASDKVFSWDNASVYFLLTDRFVNGNTSNDHSYNRLKNPDGSIVSTSSLNSDVATFHGGDFAGITKKINEGYFDNLGVNALWISAPYEQIHGYVIVNEGKSNSIKHYAYHGYYALDYTQTDANFGTAAEFKTMVDTAHNHGIRIVLDIVMNHPGYNTLYDMKEYGYGALKSSYNWDQVMGFYYDWKYNAHYHEGIDYTSTGAASGWSNWWGGDWLRAGITGYPALGGDDLTRSAGGDLPDFRTENTSTVELPKILKNKWTKEGRYTTEMNKLNSYFASGKSKTVRNYLVYWLSQWVEQYGVDGFRCDTAKHVELASWKALKDQCNQSLNTWRKNNKGKTDAASWTDNFWMTAEDYGSGVNYDNYYSQGGFDSKINFSFTGGGGVPNSSSINNTYSEYANKINTKDGFNVLTYISSHDTTLCRNDLYYQGSAFQLLPGAIQIFYGDESNRKVLNSTVGGEGDHLVRSDMNWSSTDKDVLAHWQKVGQFRNNHIAVGAGSHTKVDSTSGTAFARVYDKNGVRDTVLACIGASNNTNVTISVGKFIQDGVTVTNAYDKKTAVVSGGKVTFNSGAHGTILLETAPAKPGPTVSVSNTGGEFKTNTLSITATLNDLAKSGTYQIGKASPVTFTKTATFSIGADMDFDESVDVKYTATDGSKTYTVTYTYTKVDPSATPFKFPTATTTYLLDKAGWGSANCYAWIKDTTTSNAPWPGESMKLVGQFEGSNVYEYDVTNKYNMVIFNSSSKTDDLTFTPYSYFNNSTNSWVSVDPPTPPTPTTPTTPSQPTTQPTTQHYTQPTTEEPFTISPYPPTEWTATPPSTLILGDTDFDSFVTITDATFIQKCLARIISFTDEQNLCGDITGDGLDITDATLVQKWLARFTVPYPIGQPIGSDPTVAPSTSTTPTQPIPTTPPSGDKNTVYVDMGKECNAYAHYWEDQGESPIQWPGVAMNHVS
ncbi:MAG: starch-binding protein, partial [Oscillospiraceae bacterium]|nr:starch-binding protein [Candidatus Ruminococcus equi]